jgi:hypothetical protein
VRTSRLAARLFSLRTPRKWKKVYNIFFFPESGIRCLESRYFLEA